MPSPVGPSSRLSSVDALRGVVMILMALDHTRDFFHAQALLFQPEDLTRTTPALFLTRWVTHFCLPVFMFLAGMGIFFWWRRNHTRNQLARFLLTRGLWLMLLEVTVMRLAYNFNFSPRFPILLLVLWGFGACMIVMAGLVYLPLRALAVVSVAVIVLHNCLDGISAAQFGSAAWIWILVHQPGGFKVGDNIARVVYPLIPWTAVMAAGFCFGRVFLLAPERRQRIAFRIGLALTITFIVLRAVNVYGDPAPWAVQRTWVLTVLSFLRCTKYPGSLDFLLMTLGPALMVLAWLDRRTFAAANPLVVFGRVPLFYFIAHFYAIHLLAALMAWFRYGAPSFRFLFSPPPTMGAARGLFPSNYGYDLWVVYAMWMVIVASMYPLCRWFARVKQSRDTWWVSYL